MMSLSAIRHRNQEAAAIAAAKDKRPVELAAEDVEAGEVPKMPYLGSHRPEGFRLIDEHLVDATGVGRSWEPALTKRQFLERARVGHFYAVISHGQFQAVVGEFVRETES